MERTEQSVGTVQSLGTAKAVAASAGSWVLDPTATTIELHTKAIWGFSKVKATFAALEGSAVVDPRGDVTGTLVVDATSVDTGTAKRDNHLRSKDFFEVDKFPTFVYTVQAARVADNDAVTFSGTLMVHGQTRPLEVRSTAKSAGPDKVVLTAEADVDRSQWGLTWRKGASFHNHLVITAAFTRQ
jgi:polyisoprenoid-binding protein YceI